MKRNLLQGRWILSRGWLPKELIRQAYREAENQPGSDLCAVLLARSHLTFEQVQQTRNTSAYAMAAHINALSDQAVAKFLSESSSDDETHMSGQMPVAFNREGLETKELDSFIKTMKMIREGPRGQSGRQLSPAPALPPSPKRLPEAGEIFNEYEILQKISQGSAGTVLRARHRWNNRVVALKFLNSTNPGEVEIHRFQRETTILGQMSHPHIIEFFDSGYEAEHFYFAMANIQGPNLKEMIKEKLRTTSVVPPWQRSAKILLGIAKALAYCHERKIVHRDVKPSNIVLDSRSQKAILVDFGLIKRKADGSSSPSHSSQAITKTGEILGTPAFMSPEQFVPTGSFGEVGTHSDVWSFGATLYYSLTGDSPFSKTCMVEIYKAVVSATIVPPGMENPDLPQWLDDLCMDCLQRNPLDRPDMETVVDLLEEGLETAKVHSYQQWAGITVALILSIFTGFFLARPAEKAKLTYVLNPAKETKSHSVVIKGRVDTPLSQVKLNGLIQQCDGQGQFEFEVPLKEGENAITLQVVDGDPLASTFRTTITKDTVPPFVDFENKSIQINGEDVLVLDSKNQLSGVVRDTHQARLIAFLPDFGRKTMDLVPSDPKFELSLSPSSRIEMVRITARDSFDNRKETVYRVISQKLFQAREQAFEERKAIQKFVGELKAIKQQRTGTLDDKKRSELIDAAWVNRWGQLSGADSQVLRPLSDINLWRKTSNKDQDRAISWVARRMAPSMSYVSTDRFRGTLTRSDRIGRFQHRASGIEFQLIPGTVTSVSIWANTDVETVHHFIRVFAHGFWTADMLEDFLISRRFSSLKKIILQSYPHLQEVDTLSIVQFFSGPKRRAELTFVFKKLLSQLEAGNPNFTFFHVISPFFASRFEVTESEWLRVARNPQSSASQIPATDINYHTLKVVLDRSKLRLLGKSEWLYACSTGTRDRFFWGNNANLRSKYVWSRANATEAQSTLKHMSICNSFGLSDMLGNVAEWVDPEWDLWYQQWEEKLRESKSPATLSKNLIHNYQKSKNTYSYLMGGDYTWNEGFIEHGMGYRQSISSSTQEGAHLFGFRAAMDLR
ncbi:MAG: protein kinase [Planctomycetota bacterium]|nr:protein kinase [Planctomycetota bacterium]